MRRIFVVGVVVALGVLVGCGAEGDDGPGSAVDAIAAGNVALCQDGTYSDNTDFADTCNSHDEVDRWLAAYGRCADDTVIKMSTDARCGDGGFDELFPADYEPEPGADDIASCQDGTFSDNTDFADTCNSHGGVGKWLAAWGECGDGTLIRMSGDASCDDHDGFGGLKAEDFEPSASDGDVARCDDGTFSDNTDFVATCSSHGGVDAWLATYGECGDGHVVRLSPRASCDDHDGFLRLLPEDYEPPPPTTAAPTTTTTAPPPPPTTAPPTTAAPTPPPTLAPEPPSGGGGCNPNYSGCVPNATDVDCAGGSGNGPEYVSGPVTVIGSDVYGLDNNGDGIGCENG